MLSIILIFMSNWLMYFFRIKFDDVVSLIVFVIMIVFNVCLKLLLCSILFNILNIWWLMVLYVCDDIMILYLKVK